MTDVVHLFAGKTLFTKLDCSQAYRCVQRPDPLSVQIITQLSIEKIGLHKVSAKSKQISERI